MSYYLTYQVTANNRRSNEIKIEFYRKDIDPGSVTSLSNQEFTALRILYPDGVDNKYPLIAGCEATIALRITTASTITPETFLTEYYDEWKVIVYCDSTTVFAGFIEPSEGGYKMKDPPFDLSIKCTDGLGLLKMVDLTDVNENSFLSTVPTLIEFIAGALKKTNLDLNIRIYCNLFESSMSDRSDSPLYDMFNQAKTDYQTFLKNPIDFDTCYEALTKILTGGFTLFQYQGKWVISYRPEMQGTIGPTNYYTEYDSSGAAISSGQDLGTQVNIGFNEQQHPIELDQIVSSQFAVKSVKTIYNYNVWPEIPKNSKFDRGDILLPLFGNVYEPDDNGDDTATLIGTYQGYEVDDWTFGDFPAGPTAIANLPNLSPSINAGWKKSSRNSYNIELNREIVIPKSDSVTKVFQSSAIPVNAGDKLSISFDFRWSYNETITSGPGGNDPLRIGAVIVYIIPATGGTKWWWRSGAGVKNSWRQNAGSSESIFMDDYNAGDKTKLYRAQSLTSAPIPVDGTAYVQLVNANSLTIGANEAYFKNFTIDYLPFVAGGYVQVKGDYWKTAQDANVKDVIEEEVFLSDSQKKVLRGALLRNDGVTLTTPTWYRYGRSESKHYKELLNLGKYCHYYRRYRKITGLFRGVKCYSENDPTSFFPLGFHKQIKFVNNSSSRQYVIAPPLDIDYLAGRFNATFIESFDSSGALGTVPETYTDSEQGGDSHEFKYIF